MEYPISSLRMREITKYFSRIKSKHMKRKSIVLTNNERKFKFYNSTNIFVHYLNFVGQAREITYLESV